MTTTTAPLSFKIDRAELTESLAYVAKAVPTRPAVPILAGVLIEADSTQAIVGTFDYDESRTAELGARDITPGKALVSCKTITEWIKKLGKGTGEVTFTLAPDGLSLRLTFGAARIDVPTMPVEDYPTLPQSPDGIGKVNLAVLAGLVARVALSAGTDKTLPMMTGVNVTFQDSWMHMDATDRYRLACGDLRWTPRDHSKLPSAMLIPASTFADVIKAFAKRAGKDGGTVYLAQNHGIVGLYCGPYTWTSRLLDVGSYPKVRELFAKSYQETGTVVVADLIAAVGRVMAGVGPAYPVRLTWSTDTLTVASGSDDQHATGEAGASEEMACTYTGSEEITIAMNPAYLVDGLKSANAKTACVAMIEGFKPAVITAPDTSDFRYLIMPIRVGRGVSAPAASTPATPSATAATEGTDMPTTKTTATKTTTARKSAPAKKAPAASAPVEQAAPELIEEHEQLAQRVFDAMSKGEFVEAVALIEQGKNTAGGYLVAGRFHWEDLREMVREAARTADAQADVTPAPVTAPVARRAPGKGEPARDARDILAVATWSTDGVLLAGAMRGDEYRAVAGAVKPLNAAWDKAGKGFRFADGVDGRAVLAAWLASEPTSAPAPVVTATPVAPVKATRMSTKKTAPAPLVVPDSLASLDAAELDEATARALIAAGQAALARLTGTVVDATPVARVKAAPASAGATVAYELAQWTPDALTYRAARTALREALRAAGVSAHVEVGATKRDFTVTSDAPRTTVDAIVGATVALSQMVDA